MHPGHLHSLSGWATYWLDRRSFRASAPNEAFKKSSEFYAMPEVLDEKRLSEIAVITAAGPDQMKEPTVPWDPLQNGRNGSEDDASAQDDSSNAPDTVEGLDRITTSPGTAPHSSPLLSSSAEHRTRSFLSRITSPTSPIARPKRPLQQVFAINNLEDVSSSIVRTEQNHWPGPHKVWGALGGYSSSTVEAMPHCPVFLARMQNLCLFQSPRLELFDRTHPLVTIDDPLDQEVPLEWQDHYIHADRMNLTQYIPELGVILAGSPKGRVAVLTLHVVRNTHLTELSAQPLYTMRLDAILPTSKQERKGQRPSFPLSGLAAGPVQGQLNGTSAEQQHNKPQRTWRVLLLFRDESVLAYEIWRKGGKDAELGVGGVEDIHI